MELPIQSAPIVRSLTSQGGQIGDGAAGVEATAACDDLTGMAQQMCYAVTYGVT